MFQSNDSSSTLNAATGLLSETSYRTAVLFHNSIITATLVGVVHKVVFVVQLAIQAYVSEISWSDLAFEFSVCSCYTNYDSVLAFSLMKFSQKSRINCSMTRDVVLLKPKVAELDCMCQCNFCI